MNEHRNAWLVHFRYTNLVWNISVTAQEYRANLAQCSTRLLQPCTIVNALFNLRYCSPWPSWSFVPCFHAVLNKQMDGRNSSRVYPLTEETQTFTQHAPACLASYKYTEWLEADVFYPFTSSWLRTEFKSKSDVVLKQHNCFQYLVVALIYVKRTFPTNRK